MALFRRKIMNAKSAVNAVSDEIGPVECSNINEITYLIVGSTGVSAGAVQPETAHITGYTGTWAAEGTAATLAANSVKSIAVTGVTHVRRVRISTAVVGGTVDVWAIGKIVMAGTRRDGILLVDDVIEGAGTGVQGDVIIISPIGVKPSSSSVSVAIASDQLPLPVDISSAGAIDAVITNVPLPITGTVNINNTVSIAQPIIVQGTDLDIRDLVFATDKVNVSGSNVNATITNAILAVSAVDLDIRNLIFATDKVDVSGSTVNINGTIPISGSIAITGIVTVTATDLDIRNLTFAQDKVDVSGSTVTVNNVNTTSTSTVTSVADSAVSVQLLAVKATRKGYKLFNDSAAVAYVKEGSSASYTSFTYKIQPDWLYESVGIGSYTGVITCVWASVASGSMRVTELE